MKLLLAHFVEKGYNFLTFYLHMACILEMTNLRNLVLICMIYDNFYDSHNVEELAIEFQAHFTESKG